MKDKVFKFLIYKYPNKLLLKEAVIKQEQWILSYSKTEFRQVIFWINLEETLIQAMIKKKAT